MARTRAPRSSHRGRVYVAVDRSKTHTAASPQSDLLPGPYRLFLLFFVEKVRRHSRPKHRFPLKVTFLTQKMTKQHKDTIGKRAKEVPESGKTVCWEIEWVRGCAAQDWGGCQRTLPHFRRIYRGFLVVATNTFRTPARQHSVQI